jgi:hypothetical protein
MNIIVIGNVVDGLGFIGPFEDHTDAIQYAEAFRLKDWVETELKTPEETSDKVEAGVPNLDSCHIDYLDVVKTTFTALTSYCHYRKQADFFRKNGSIEKAQALEKVMERVYSGLPAWAKW